jgi:hypothetical protein
MHFVTPKLLDFVTLEGLLFLSSFLGIIAIYFVFVRNRVNQQKPN